MYYVLQNSNVSNYLFQLIKEKEISKTIIILNVAIIRYFSCSVNWFVIGIKSMFSKINNKTNLTFITGSIIDSDLTLTESLKIFELFLWNSSFICSIGLSVNVDDSDSLAFLLLLIYS